jgi:acyl-CoA dehydrogenase
MDFSMTAEQKRLKEETRQFIEQEVQPFEEKIDREGKIPTEILEKFKKRGYFGTNTPKEYGGLGLGMLGNCLIVEELGRTSIAIFYTVSMNIHIGSKAILLAGSEEQKRKYLPPLAKGELIGCYALTEPEAGSDPASMHTRAVREGDKFIINGKKCFITNAPIADVFTLFAVTDQKAKTSQRITAFIIEKDTDGLSIGKIHQMCGGRGSYHSEVILKDCAVPARNVIGEIGKGFIIAMKCLDDGRTNWAAYSLGATERLLEMSVRYAKERIQFGKPIGANQAIQWMLADTKAELQAAKMLTYNAAWKYDQGIIEPDDSAMTKLITSEMVWRAADMAVEVHGGLGYCKDLPFERILRDVRIIRALEGTSEIMRLVVARKLLGTM